GGRDPVRRHSPRDRECTRQIRRRAFGLARCHLGGCRVSASPRAGALSMLTLAAPILVFGLVIFVHEFGHFVAAKLTGVYAPRFSVGFGPAPFPQPPGGRES